MTRFRRATRRAGELSNLPADARDPEIRLLRVSAGLYAINLCQELVAAMKKVKSNVDSGQFEAVQEAGCAALESDQACVEEMRRIYTERRDALVQGLRAAGLDAPSPKATFYVWLPVPSGYTSAQFSGLLLEEAGIVCTPGNGFGEPGEGYVRMALTVPRERLEEAVERIKKVL